MQRVLRTTTQVNGKGGNSTPAPSETPEPIVTKSCMVDYVGDPYLYAKFYHDTIPPFAPQICEIAHQVTRLVFFVSSDSLQPRPLHRFSRSIRQMTRFRARICLLGVPKTKFYISTPFPPKTANFWPIFDGTNMGLSTTPYSQVT